ncbi:MAG: DinB family protein [Chloroflexota bacterium]
MDTGFITTEVVDQFERVFELLRKGVGMFTPGNWREGESSYMRPAGLVYHLLETVDYYTSGKGPDDYPWGHRFNLEWEEKDSEKFPNQEEMLVYLEEMQARVREWLEHADPTTVEELHPWTGTTLLGKALYVLRHTQHHTAELGVVLFEKEERDMGWR